MPMPSIWHLLKFYHFDVCLVWDQAGYKVYAWHKIALQHTKPSFWFQILPSIFYRMPSNAVSILPLDFSCLTTCKDQPEPYCQSILSPVLHLSKKSPKSEFTKFLKNYVSPLFDIVPFSAFADDKQIVKSNELLARLIEDMERTVEMILNCKEKFLKMCSELLN